MNLAGTMICLLLIGLGYLSLMAGIGLFLVDRGYITRETMTLVMGHDEPSPLMVIIIIALTGLTYYLLFIRKSFTIKRPKTEKK